MRFLLFLTLLATSCQGSLDVDDGGQAEVTDTGASNVTDSGASPTPRPSPDGGHLSDAGATSAPDAGEPLPDAGIALDAGGPLLDAGPPPDAGGSGEPTPDAGHPDDAGTADAGGTPVVVVDPPPPTPVTLSTTYYRADATAPRGVSVWATESYPPALPENARSTIFWGRFQGGGCAAQGSGLLASHPLTFEAGAVFDARYPDCAGSFGPSVEADVLVNGTPQHLLRAEVRPGGAFQGFGASGQNAFGANAHIQAVYVQLSPSWRANVPNRMLPWGGPSTDPALIRFALRTQQSVTRDLLESPSNQQLQQVLRMLVINEACDPQTSSSFCQIEFNFKTYIRGVNAYTSFGSGDVFNDSGQGGLIAVVGPIAEAGASTQINGTSAWTSWGASTQRSVFNDETFQVEMSWAQFQQLLLNVTGGSPASVFGASWQERNAWVLLRIGYGQENYNPSATASSLIEGLFESIEIFAL